MTPLRQWVLAPRRSRYGNTTRPAIAIPKAMSRMPRRYTPSGQPCSPESGLSLPERVMTAPMIAVSSASTMEALTSTFAVQSVMALWVRHANSVGVIDWFGDVASSVAEVFHRLAKILNIQCLPDSFRRVPVTEAGLLAGSARAALVVREPVAK